MGRRNPMNERYGKHTAPAGKTRKSAASAKPKRAQGSPAVAKTKKADSVSSKKRQAIVHPETPEYRRWRGVWWALLVSPIVVIVLSFGVLKQPGQEKLAYSLVGLSYALIIGAVLLDIFKLGKLRREWVENSAQRKTPQS